MKVTAKDPYGSMASASFDIVVTALPTVTISGLGPKIAGPVTATITFSAVVTGFAEADLAITRGTASDFTEVTTGKVFTVRLTLKSEFNGRTMVLTIPAGAAMDVNGNGNKRAKASIVYQAPLRPRPRSPPHPGTPR
ncbi:MAG: hypothetical protein F4158_09830 [Synechococcus sp. SB0675_bin_7]|nr:hypothetical protein [Synechococcus sp. SB0675_bin_7]